MSAAAAAWPALGPYEEWRATCDTLHAHTQVLGKLCVALARPEPQLQHAALRLTARGWETPALPAPNGGLLVVALDLGSHEAVVEHSGGARHRVPLTPDRPVGEVTREVLDLANRVAGRIAINATPQEVPWDVPLDRDDVHRSYDAGAVARYMAAATQASTVLAALRAPYLGRSTPVNAWWGTFDLAVSLFSGRAAEPPSQDFIMRNSGNAQQVEVGWWPGDGRYPKPAFFGFAAPAPESFSHAELSPARWEPDMGEYLLDWDDVIASADPLRTALEFGRGVVDHACSVCDWDPALADSTRGIPPPIT